MRVRQLGCLSVLLVVMSFTPCVVCPQDESSDDDISIALDQAFETFKSESGISFHPAVEVEWKREYRRVVDHAVKLFTSDDCQYPMRCEAHIEMISRPSEIEKSLKGWTRTLQSNEPVRFWFPGLRAAAEIACMGSAMKMGTGTASKYGYLLIQTDPKDIEANIFINQKYMGRTPKVEKCVVPRHEALFLEIKGEGFRPLAMNVTVEGEEPKTVKYPPREKEE